MPWSCFETPSILPSTSAIFVSRVRAFWNPSPARTSASAATRLRMICCAPLPFAACFATVVPPSVQPVSNAGRHRRGGEPELLRDHRRRSRRPEPVDPDREPVAAREGAPGRRARGLDRRDRDPPREQERAIRLVLLVEDLDARDRND